MLTTWEPEPKRNQKRILQFFKRLKEIFLKLYDCRSLLPGGTDLFGYAFHSSLCLRHQVQNLESYFWPSDPYEWFTPFGLFNFQLIRSGQFSSVPQSYSTLCDPMYFNKPGLPIHHQIPEFTQTHVMESVMPSNHLILCHPLLLSPSIFPSIRVFPMSQFFTSSGQIIGVSASASVLPIQDFQFRTDFL